MSDIDTEFRCGVCDACDEAEDEGEDLCAVVVLQQRVEELETELAEEKAAHEGTRGALRVCVDDFNDQATKHEETQQELENYRIISTSRWELWGVACDERDTAIARAERAEQELADCHMSQMCDGTKLALQAAEARAEKAEAAIEGHRASASIFAVSEREWKARALAAETRVKLLEAERYGMQRDVDDSRARAQTARKDALREALNALSQFYVDRHIGGGNTRWLDEREQARNKALNDVYRAIVVLKSRLTNE